MLPPGQFQGSFSLGDCLLPLFALLLVRGLFLLPRPIAALLLSLEGKCRLPGSFIVELAGPRFLCAWPILRWARLRRAFG
jgi:hypothetical protein